MNFQRARTDEQIYIRRNQIIEVATKLYDESGYEAVTFSNISKATNFTRPTIYKYYQCGEEILLDVLSVNIHKWVDALSSGIKPNMSNNEFADLLTNAYTTHPRVISLFSILYSVLEKRSSIDALACFKEGLLKKNTVLLDELQRLFPNASNKQLTLFFTIQLATAIGLYPMTHPSENQLCALKKINKKNEFQSFESLFKESILIHINTL